MKKWKDTLPTPARRVGDADGREWGEAALRRLSWALANERLGQREQLLVDVRWAAAYVRMWRTSLPESEQGESRHIESQSMRSLIRMAVADLQWADYRGSGIACGNALRWSEAALRTLGKRLMAEADQ